MSQHDYVIANGTGAAVRSDLNNALAAIVSQNSGATEPATMYAYQWWADTTTGLLKLRNAANNAWITLFQLDGEWNTLAVENGSAAAPSIYFKNSGTDTGIYSPGADQVAISTGGTERARIDSSGRLLVGTSTANTSGAKLQTVDGITFPATQVASADPNTLDDYEEGTFTVYFEDAPGNRSSTSVTGYYTKIGRLVTMSFTGASTISTAGLNSGDDIRFTTPFVPVRNTVGSVNTNANVTGSIVPVGSNGQSRGAFRVYSSSGQTLATVANLSSRNITELTLAFEV